MAFKLSVGKTAVLGCDAYHNEAIASMDVADEVLRSYLLWALPAMAEHAAKNPAIMGATLNSKSIASIWVPVPPREEQARLISTLTVTVEALEALVELSEDLRESAGDTLKLLAQERALTAD